ncbi:MAG TPA: hypothetical protein VMS02_03380 [Solirubrobacteraceae bacterium]|nr:hypothetical protein [Solirubrobacteraceae bacterium]
MSDAEHPAGYDLQLPILAELEAAFVAEARALAGAGEGAGDIGTPRDVHAEAAQPEVFGAHTEKAAGGHLPAGRGRRRGTHHRQVAAGRVTRRALILVALLSLVGASALAGSSVLDDSHPRPPSGGPVSLTVGGSGAERWQLQAYTHGDASCYALFVAETVTSACGAPPPGAGLLVSSALGPDNRFVAGLAGHAVRRVLVRVGAGTRLAPTAPVTRRSGAGLPAGLRWFLAVLPADSAGARSTPARVTPLDAAGRPLARATLDCSVGAGGRACQAAAARVAGGFGGG